MIIGGRDALRMPPSMPLVSRLVSYLGEALGSDRVHEEPQSRDRLAVAAFLVHVARVDGILDRSERERLISLLRGRFGLTDIQAGRLLEAGAALDSEWPDLAALVEAVATETGDEDRRRLLAMGFAIAKADGQMHEFEEDLLWRVGHLLGFDDDEILGQRDALPAPALPDDPGEP